LRYAAFAVTNMALNVKMRIVAGMAAIVLATTVLNAMKMVVATVTIASVRNAGYWTTMAT
jgi:hypothetical protein